MDTILTGHEATLCVYVLICLQSECIENMLHKCDDDS